MAETRYATSPVEHVRRWADESTALMLQAKPGAFARLGQGGAEEGCFLHSSRYDFNDSVIPLGAGYLTALAERGMPVATDR